MRPDQTSPRTGKEQAGVRREGCGNCLLTPAVCSSHHTHTLAQSGCVPRGRPGKPPLGRECGKGVEGVPYLEGQIHSATPNLVHIGQGPAIVLASAWAQLQIL